MPIIHINYDKLADYRGDKYTVELAQDRWDDWGKYQTQFYLSVKNETTKENIEIGHVKIGQKNLQPATSGIAKKGISRIPNVPESFDQLSEEFFSLGQGQYFYEQIMELDEKIALAILDALRDIVYISTLIDSYEYSDSSYENIYNLYKDEYVFTESLMREISVYELEKYRTIVMGQAALTRFNFEHDLDMHHEGDTVANDNNTILTVTVDPYSQLPTNIHAIIGRNGVGKSHALKKIAALQGQGNGVARSQSLFSKVLHVITSIFDYDDESVKQNDDINSKIQTLGIINTNCQAANNIFSFFPSITQDYMYINEQIDIDLFRLELLDILTKAYYQEINEVRSYGSLDAFIRELENEQCNLEKLHSEFTKLKCEKIKKIITLTSYHFAKKNLLGVRRKNILAKDIVKTLQKFNNRMRDVLKKVLVSFAYDTIFAEFNLDMLLSQNINERELISQFNRLSSGHAIILLLVVQLVANTSEKTLILLDEPESHLHPPLLSAFIRALSELAKIRNAVVLCATHSPIVLQEIPRACVWKISRSGCALKVDRPSIETFGENLGILTREIFGYEVSQSGFHKLLADKVAEGKSYKYILNELGNQLGFEGKLLLSNLIANRR